MSLLLLACTIVWVVLAVMTIAHDREAAARRHDPT
jgi:hypothetical protein